MNEHYLLSKGFKLNHYENDGDYYELTIKESDVDYEDISSRCGFNEETWGDIIFQVYKDFSRYTVYNEGHVWELTDKELMNIFILENR